jgi:hypothetical protein
MKNSEIDELLAVVRMPEKERTTVEDRLQLAEDHRRIQDLVMAYGWLCDRRNWDELLDLYTDDFERRLGGTLDEVAKGKETLRELYFRPVLPRSGGAEGPPSADVINTYELRHLIHPPVIRVADDNNDATVGAVYSLVATSGDGPDLRRGEHEGIYIFGLRREPEHGWRFATMKVISENSRNLLFQKG